MAPDVANTPENTSTRITRSRLRHTITPPSISKPEEQINKKPAESPIKAHHDNKSFLPIYNADMTTTQVAGGDTKAGATTISEGVDITQRLEKAGLEEETSKTIQVPGKEQEAEQEATTTTAATRATTAKRPPPKRKIKIKINIRNNAITKLSTKSSTKSPPKPEPKTTKTRLRSSPPCTSNQGNIIKTARPAANDVFLNGKRLNLLYEDGFQQMRDFWEDFGGCVDAGGEFL